MKPFRTVTQSTGPYDAELTHPRVGYAARYENEGPAADRQAAVAARAARAMRDGDRYMDGTARNARPRITHGSQWSGLSRDHDPWKPRADEHTPQLYAAKNGSRQTEREAG